MIVKIAFLRVKILMDNILSQLYYCNFIINVFPNNKLHCNLFYRLVVKVTV